MCLWNAESGKLKGNALKSHNAFITCICWQPIYIGADKAQLVSSSKDNTWKVWNGHAVARTVGLQQQRNVCALDRQHIFSQQLPGQNNESTRPTLRASPQKNTDTNASAMLGTLKQE